MLKDLVNHRTPHTFGVPTPGKELPKSIRYANGLCVSRLDGAITSYDPVRDLRVPNTVKGCQASQYLTPQPCVLVWLRVSAKLNAHL